MTAGLALGPAQQQDQGGMRPDLPLQQAHRRRRLARQHMGLGQVAAHLQVQAWRMVGEQRLQELGEQMESAQKRLADLEKRWQEENRIAAEVQKLREQLEKHAASTAPKGDPKDKLAPAEEARCREEYTKLITQLRELQGENPLVQPVVSSQAIAEVVSGWTVHHAPG